VARAIQALKAGGRHDERHPAGSPGGVGGQFAPSAGGGGEQGRATLVQATGTASRRPAHERHHGPFGQGNPGLTFGTLPDTGNVNWGLIHSFENPNNVGPHIPAGRDNGVTIGPGINLGQISRAEIAHLDERLRRKLEPWIGKTIGADVTLADRLERQPPTFTNEEITQVSQIVMKRIHGQIATAFEAQTGRSFSALPEPLQTVAASVGWQYGPNALTRRSGHRAFWNAVKAGDAEAAAAALSRYRGYRRRRETEIRYLRSSGRGATTPT
jgi:GH24 family phage-related lysozyme (muramidase)